MWIKEVEVTIAAGESLSTALDIRIDNILSIKVPSTWTAASISFLGSIDDTTFDEVYTKDNVLFEQAVTAGKLLQLDAINTLGYNHLKIQSGTAASPVNQTVEAVIKMGSGQI